MGAPERCLVCHELFEASQEKVDEVDVYSRHRVLDCPALRWEARIFFDRDGKLRQYPEDLEEKDRDAYEAWFNGVVEDNADNHETPLTAGATLSDAHFTGNGTASAFTALVHHPEELGA